MWGRRGKMSELTQHMTPHRPEVQMHGNKGVRGSKEFINGGKGYHGVHGSSTVAGSGMRAIFLGGSGSQNVMNGTGVFLPRSTTDATVQGRKKTGTSLGVAFLLTHLFVKSKLKLCYRNREKTDIQLNIMKSIKLLINYKAKIYK